MAARHDDRNGRTVASTAGDVVAAALLALALAGCSTPSPAPTARGSQPASSQPARSPSLQATGAAGSFDPTRVTLSLVPFAIVAGGPLAITAPRDGTGRLFVASQDGRAWVVEKDGTTRSTPLLDIRDRITSGGERGLLGLAIHPSFPRDPRVFVDYTDLHGDTVVASFDVDVADPNRLDPSSAETIFQADQPFANHNGGALAFGPDGDLYISLGDGGSGGDPQGNGQDLGTPLAKILRVDVDHPGGGRPYGIPADNPFAATAGALPEIWLTGLRNPWRMSFDRATGDLWIGDVGQGAREEVDVARAGIAGLNYGWNRMEGMRCFKPADGCDQSGLTLPVADYGHDQGCVVIGGVVYRGSQFPFLRGGYLYADYCSGIVWALDAAAPSPTAAVVGNLGNSVVAFGEDEAGEVYVASLAGTVSRLVAGSR
jgi:glucose/arabinose dehydrogenase